MAWQQLYELLVSAGVGVLAGVVYDLFRAVRRVFDKYYNYGGHTVLRAILVAIQDAIFCLMCTIAIFAVSMWLCEGTMRFYLFLGAFLGFIIYLQIFSRVILKFEINVFAEFCRLFIKLVRLLIWPIKYLIGILLLPIKLTFKLFRKIAKGVKIRLEKLWMKSSTRRNLKKLSHNVRAKRRSRAKRKGAKAAGEQASIANARRRSFDI